MSLEERAQSLDVEVELIQASLLPAEKLDSSPAEQWPRILDITSTNSRLSLKVSVSSDYPSRDALSMEVRGDIGRDEAEEWRSWAKDHLNEWNPEEEYPLYQILTAHFLPILAPASSSPSPEPDAGVARDSEDDARLHHALMTSHHLLSPTKRKDLQSLSSELSLVGFAKTGHPGIMYAMGQRDDLQEWIRQVKSWQWLALRVRLTPEPIDSDGGKVSVKGEETGARHGKGRGEWREVEKVGEALEWLRERGRDERMLTDFGIGGGRS